MSAIQLSDRHKAIVAAILAEAGDRIGAVKVFGSRAMGRARSASDLDLVVLPPASEGTLRDLRFAFEESDLPIFVDVIAWEQIKSPELRAEIERWGVPWIA